MNRCIGFRLIALAVAQIFSSNVMAATFPTGQVEINAASTALVLQSALFLGTAPASPSESGTQNAGTTYMSATPTTLAAPSSVIANPSVDTSPISPLALKLDTSLNNAAPAFYEMSPTGGFSFVALDPLLTIGGGYAATPQVFSGSTRGLTSTAGSPDSSGTSTSALDEMLPPLGRSATLESTGHDGATDLTLNDLMRFLDEFSGAELASSSMRVPLIFSANGLEDKESTLFLRPDAVVSEPGTLALFAFSLLALRAARRRR